MTTAANYGLRFEVEDLYRDYAACLDRGRVTEWPDFFTQDGTYMVKSAETHDQGLPHAAIYCDSMDMIQDRAAAISKTLFHEPRKQRRFVSSVRISNVDQYATLSSTATLMVVESLEGVAPKITFTGQYFDTLARENGVLKIRDRLVVYDNDVVDRSIIYPL